ncbi:MAG: terpene cyclase/mutase family protein [Planctomycetes bacterium]|nr:terpene cyclase/mutase family protein [Planctomycetota bacterium]
MAHARATEAGFEADMRETLRRSPWLLLSAGLHAAAILVLMQFDFRRTVEPTPLGIVVTLQDEALELLEPPVVVPPPPVTPEVQEVVADEPVIVEETVVPLPASDASSELSALDDSPFTGRGDNGCLGTGGGAGRPGGGPYGQRVPGRGGSTATQCSVALGLEWLRRHQDPRGHWDADGFHSRCGETLCDGKGHAMNDVGCTGLSLLAFLGAGHTSRSGAHRGVVRDGLRWLQSVQDPDDGCIGSKSGQHFLYGHALATLALVEGYHLSREPLLRRPAQDALHFISRSRNPYKAWRYAYPPDGDNDVSVSGWMLFALFAGREAQLVVDDAAIKDGMAYLEEMTDPTSGRTGYHEKGSFSAREPEAMERWPADRAEAMTAVAALLRIFHDPTAQSPALAGATRLLAAKPPRWDAAGGGVDYYYWYYGSYAMFQQGGREWDAWSRAMEPTVVSHQRREGCETGAWDPQFDPWGANGGRVYATAINTLCLEVYYRYTRLLGSR